MCSKHLYKVLASFKFNHNLKFIDQLLTQAITDGRIHGRPTWNSILRAYVKSPTPVKAILLYNHHIIKQNSSTHPDNYTYPPLLKACSCIFSLPIGMELHAHITKIGLDCDVYVQNALIHFYGRMRELASARLLFDKMSNRDIATWNTLLGIYCNTSGYLFQVLVLFRTLICEEIKVDKITMVILFSACAELEQLNYGRALHCYVTKVGLKSLLNLENAMLNMYTKCGEMNEASKLFNAMGLRKDVVSHTIMITGYVEMGFVDLAAIVFKMVVNKDPVLWGSMIHAYVKANQPNEALELFKKMVEERIIPNENTMVSVLSACASVLDLSYGRLVHKFIIRNNINQDVYVKTAIIDMYSKCGSLDDALVTFYKTDTKDVFTWTTIIEGLANYGHGEEALCMFNQMESEGIAPNEATFVSVLSACSHSGLVNEGCRLFRRIAMITKIRPRIEHFGCLVDMLSRAGLLYQAEEFVEIMEAEDKRIAYKTLLSACFKYSMLELGAKIADKMMELGPLNYEVYILLSNFYAALGQWNKVTEARRIMKKFDLMKNPGNSFVEN